MAHGPPRRTPADLLRASQSSFVTQLPYDYAASRVKILDNRALGVACYHPGHTLVEKLQAISTEFRQQ